VLSSLASDGLWIVGRTADEAARSHNATILRTREGGTLEIIERVGLGSEIEELALRASQDFSSQFVGH
jgi:hypothetical protein